MIKFFILAVAICTLPTHAAVFTCGKMSAAEFVSAVGATEKKFKDMIKTKSEENREKPEESTAAAIHDFIGANDWGLIGLLMWPELTEGKLFYYRAFLRCGTLGRTFVKTLTAAGPNHSELAAWKDCMKELYKDDKPEAALELDQCFSKFERKR